MAFGTGQPASDIYGTPSNLGVNPAATNTPVTATPGTLLQRLQQGRQGATRYGSIAQGLQNPEVITMLASMFAPLAMARQGAVNSIRGRVGAPGLNDLLRQFGVAAVSPGTKSNMIMQTGVNANLTMPQDVRQGLRPTNILPGGGAGPGVQAAPAGNSIAPPSFAGSAGAKAPAVGQPSYGGF